MSALISASYLPGTPVRLTSILPNIGDPGMGMVALVVVGTPANQDEAKAVSHPGRAKQVFATLFGKLDAARTASK